MNIEFGVFQLKLEQYYGQKYNTQMIEEIMRRWGHYQKKDYDIILRLVFEQIEARFNYIPDVACIKKIVDEYNEMHTLERDKIGYNQPVQKLLESTETQVTEEEKLFIKNMFDEMQLKFKFRGSYKE